MADTESGKIESEIDISVKDNGSRAINDVTNSLKSLQSEVISVDQLLTNLSKNIENVFSKIEGNFKGISGQKLEEINKALSMPSDIERSKHKNKLDDAKATEIKERKKSGYYEAEAKIMFEKAAHAGDSLAISFNRLQAEIEKTTREKIKESESQSKEQAARYRYLAAEKNNETASLKRDYWQANADFKKSDEFYAQVRSMNAARDARTRKLLYGDIDNGPDVRSMLGKGFQSMGGIVGGLREPTGIAKVISGSLQFAGKAIANPAVALSDSLIKAGKAATEFANKSIEAYQNIEVIRTNLGVISGTQSEGDRLFGDISQYAIKSPFGVQQTAEQATLLRQSGVYAEDLMDTLKMIGDLAGGNADKMRRISNDFAQITANGKANMLQLRQLGNAGVPIYKELSKELKVSAATVRSMSRDGEITAETIEKVLKNLTSEGGVFYESVEKGARTLKARVTNLEDIRTLAFSEVGDSIVNFGRGEDGISVLNKMVDIQEKFFNWMYTFGGEQTDKRDYKNLLENEKAIDKAYKKLEKASSVYEMNEIYKEIEKLQNAYSDEQRETFRYNRYKLSRENINNLEYGVGNSENRINALKGSMISSRERGDIEGYNRYLDLYNQEKSLQDSFRLRAERAESGISSDQYGSAFNVYYRQTQKVSEEALEKASKRAESLATVSDKMYLAWKKSDEYKQKEAKEQEESFKKTKNIAQELKKVTDTNGYLDLSKLETASAFDKYRDLLGIETKFNLDQSKYNTKRYGGEFGLAAASEENKAFQKNLAGAIGIINTSEVANSKDRDYNVLLNTLKSLSGLDFIKNADEFNKAFDKYYETLLKYEEGTGNQQKIAENFKRYVNPLLSGKISTNTIAADTDISEIPLWARIIANGTGLDARRVYKTGGGASLQVHEDEQYTRNITKSLLGTSARNGMNTYALLGMIRRTGNYASDKDGTRNLQIDWKLTSNNFKKFALELGQATNVTTAYRQTVENEVNTLSDLLASMPTTFEDVKKSSSFTDQFINVYEGKVKYDGQEAYYDSQTKLITTMDGQTVAIYDAMDKIEFAESTVKKLNELLEQRRVDLIEARKVEAANTVFNEGTSQYREGLYGYLAEVMFGFKAGSSQYKNFVKQGSILDTDRSWNSYNNWTSEELKQVENARNKDLSSIEAKRTKQLQLSELLSGISNTNEESKNLISKRKKIEDKYEEMWLKENNVVKGEEWNDPKNVGIWKAIQEFYRSQPEWKAVQKEINDLDKKLPGLKDNFESLKNEIDQMIPTTEEADVKAKLLREKGIENSTDFNDVLSLAMGIQRNPLLKKQDEDFKRIERLLSMKDAVRSISLDKEDYRSGYFTDRFYNKAYGYSKYDFGGILEGNRLALQNEFTGILGNQESVDKINKLMGDSSGLQLWFLANTVGGVGSDRWNELTEKVTKRQLLQNTYESKMGTLRDSLTSSFDSFAIDNINNSFVTLGESIQNIVTGLGDGSEAWKNFGKSFVESTKSLTANMGSLMTTAGLELLITGGASMLGPAMALIGAGGLSSFVSGLMDTSSVDDTEQKIKKLQSLKDDLKELLEQAKADVIYYEKEVSNRKAISTTRAMNAISTTRATNVNDAIITPSGNVISTHPDDYLIATKTPQTLVGGGNSQPVINLNIQNNSGQKLDIKSTTTNKNGEINIEAIIQGAVNKGLAEGAFDSGMSAREQRLAGRRVYM